MQYIRYRFTGSMYFITINLLNRQTHELKRLSNNPISRTPSRTD